MIRRQHRLVIALQAAQEALAESAAMAERARIAREVHDVIAHSLTVTVLHVASARLAVQDRPDKAIQALSDAERVGRQALADVRRAVGLLGPGGDAARQSPLPSVGDLATLVGEYEAAGLNVALAVSGMVGRVSSATGLALYRIVEESLSNAARHAPGARADVELRIEAQRGLLRVVNGPTRSASAAPASFGGLGLIGVRQRAELIGARLVAGPDGGGWRVEVEIPLNEDDA